VFEALKRALSLDGVQVTVGLQGTTAGERGITEMVRIAAINEYGAGHVPSRPFLRAASREHGRQWLRLLRTAHRTYIRGDTTRGEMQVRRLGLVAVGHVQASIRDGAWISNAPSTIARKGSDKPLIDSGQMRQSIRAQVSLVGARPEIIA
jgi:hypothetical protein